MAGSAIGLLVVMGTIQSFIQQKISLLALEKRIARTEVNRRSGADGLQMFMGKTWHCKNTLKAKKLSAADSDGKRRFEIEAIKDSAAAPATIWDFSRNAAGELTDADTKQKLQSLGIDKLLKLELVYNTTRPKWGQVILSSKTSIHGLLERQNKSIVWELSGVSVARKTGAEATAEGRADGAGDYVISCFLHGDHNPCPAGVVCAPHLNPDGTKGGFVANTASVDSQAEVAPKALVVGNAQVTGNARVLNSAQVSGYAKVKNKAAVYGNARISGTAQVTGNAKVYDHARVSGDTAKVFERAKVYGEAEISGDAQVYGRAKVYDNAKVRGKAKIHNEAQVFSEAEVYGEAEIESRAYATDNAKVYGKAKVYGYAMVSGHSQIFGQTEVVGRANILGNAQVFGNARVGGDAIIWGQAEVSGSAQVGGHAQVSGSAIIKGTAVVSGTGYGNMRVCQGTHTSGIVAHQPSCPLP